MILIKFIAVLGFSVLVFVPAVVFAVSLIFHITAKLFTRVLGLARPMTPLMGPILDSDFRRAFQSPNVIIQRSGIQEGMKVVEIGCGSGAFTTYVARAIGPKGTTFAVDIQQKMLKQLEAKLKKRENRDIENVKIYNHSAYHLPFEDESMDLVFFVSVLQQIPDINKALSESRRVLKTGGTLAVTETLWDPYYPICATTIKQGIAAGFSLSKLDGNFWHYTARFKK